MKRFQVFGDNENTRVEDPDGEWVRFSDVEPFVDLLAICKEALPLVEEYLQGIPEFADKMRAAIERCKEQA